MRLNDGDSPSVLTRELPLAGVTADAIHGILGGALSAGLRRRRTPRCSAW